MFHSFAIRMGHGVWLVLWVFLGLMGSVWGQAVTNIWTGSSSRDWFTSANWSQSQVPQAGHHVVITNPAGNQALLANHSAFLSSVVLSNSTLTFSNWNTTLSATDLTVGVSGIMTLPGPFTTSQMSNSIVLVCTNLSILSGGLIRADTNGYAGGAGSDGYGPGKGLFGNRGGGGAHGGRAGDGYYNSTIFLGGASNGVPHAPCLPGSSGASDNVIRRGGAGGGVIVITAAVVNVEGILSAHGGNGDSQCGGGAGGSIWIDCAQFGGTGLLRAKGGNAGTDSGGGSGGRIAVNYQSLSGAPVCQFDLAPGTSYFSGWGHSTVPPGPNAPEMGTLWMTATNWVTETQTGQITQAHLIIPGFTSWTAPSLLLSNAVIRFQDGFDLSVTGTVQILTNSALAVMGAGNLNCGNTFTVRGGDLVLNVKSQAICAADLVLTNGGEVYLFSSPTNGTTRYGAVLVVSNDFRIANTCWVYPWSHPTNGGSICFRMNNLSIEGANAGFMADGRGYAGTNLTDGFGPGKGLFHANRGSGAGYGGTGSWSYYSGWKIQGGVTNGDYLAPVAPGSGGGGSIDNRPGGYGGGLIWIEARSNVVIQGILSAKGIYGGYDAGGGSGGGIFVACQSFQGEVTASLLATGGATSGNQGGGGGGGRIAVALRLSDADKETLLSRSPVSRLVTYDQHAACRGILSVTNGLAPTGDGATNRGAGVGTLTFLTTARILTVAGNPAEYGAPTPDGYWTTPYYGDGQSITNRVATPTAPSNGVRRACLGWILRDRDGGLIDQGASTQAVFNLTTNLVLTWNWTNEYLLTMSGTGPGGAVLTNQNGWYTNGTVITGLVANASNGYLFSEWTGDVPAGAETNNPLTVTMDQPRSIAGQFLNVAGEYKVWTGSNVWESTTNWSPVGMPGSNDTVFITNGTVVCGFTRQLKNLTVGTNATLVLTNWSTVLTVTNQLRILSNGVITCGAAFATNQMSNQIHLQAYTMLVETGGLIDANGRGYLGSTNNGMGPGYGFYGSRCSGAGHGGGGGDAINNSSMWLGAGVEYGVASNPVLPGSSGGGYDVTRLGGNGGGVIRIVATQLTVNGTVRADGGAGGTWAGGGSGGSILLNAQTVSGSGLISSRGGAGGGSGAGGGAGGRVALYYSTWTEGTSLAFDGRGGNGIASNLLRNVTTPYPRPPSFGTLYLSATNGWLSNTLNRTFQGIQLEVNGLNAWSTENLLVTNCWIQWPAGFQLSVTGAVTLLGTNAAMIFQGDPGFSCGGDLILNAGQLIQMADSVISCGGRVRMTNQALWIIQSIPTNTGDLEYGTEVIIGGDVELATNSWMYMQSDPTNGGSGLIRLPNLTIAAGGGISATARGWWGGLQANGYGPGKGALHGNRGSGAGYGGQGGWSYWGGWLVAGGSPYGVSNNPILAGSGGGGVPSRTGGASGGGVVRIVAAQTLTVDGTINATGGDGGNECGGGSGGSVFLTADRVLGSAAGRIEARGGNATSGGGPGGGGRIAILYGRHYFLGTYSVTNGTGLDYSSSPEKAPTVGTLYLLQRVGQGTVFVIY